MRLSLIVRHWTFICILVKSKPFISICFNLQLLNLSAKRPYNIDYKKLLGQRKHFSDVGKISDEVLLRSLYFENSEREI